jgi:hypothetical protein
MPGGFTFLEFTNLKIKEKLFSPWHGLFSYHPSFIFAILGGLLYLWGDIPKIRSKGNIIKTFFSRPVHKNIPYVIVIYFIFTLVVLSARITWWGGTGAFGARHFVNFYPIATLSYAYLLKRFNVKSLFHPIFLISLIMVSWTLLLYLQDLGTTNFYSYTQLLDSQFKIWGFYTPIAIIVLLSTLLFSTIFFKMSKSSLNSPTQQLSILTITLILLIYTYYARVDSRSFLEKLCYSVVLTITAFVLLHFKSIIERFKINTEILFLSTFIVVVSYLVWAGFHSLELVREEPIKDFKYCGTFMVEQFVNSLPEYLQIEGYEKEKKQLKKFMDDYISYLKTNSTCYG